MTLRQARDLRGWTQEQLEELSGVEQTVISRLERRVTQNPSNDTVAKLEAALKVRRGTLVFGAAAEAIDASEPSEPAAPATDSEPTTEPADLDIQPATVRGGR